MKRAIALLLLCAISTAADDEFRARLLTHYQNMDALLAAYFGCDDSGVVSRETCRESRAHIDRKKFEQARKSAAQLFQFKEP